MSLQSFKLMFQSRREQEEARSQDPNTPLTGGQNGNGHPRPESHPLVEMRGGARYCCLSSLFVSCLSSSILQVSNTGHLQ